ncbi:hypothetical protein PG994_013340 [Apiospora phragmitis]|uniref:Uncharacterized protein n=1 Tax=Apiospora phragmitis TaxID=2905665 RepID=A0ABR1T8C2_9PEZI
MTASSGARHQSAAGPTHLLTVVDWTGSRKLSEFAQRGLDRLDVSVLGDEDVHGVRRRSRPCRAQREPMDREERRKLDRGMADVAGVPAADGVRKQDQHHLAALSQFPCGRMPVP